MSEVAAPAHAAVPPRRAPNRVIGLALLLSLLLLPLPFAGYVFYPFKLLATWIHEFAHGMVMLLSGAGFFEMNIYPNGSGLASANRAASPVARPIIAAAGYMGAPIFGAAYLMIAVRQDRARLSVVALGVALCLSAGLLIANTFGQIAMLAIGGGLIIASVALPVRAVQFIAFLVAVQSCINAVVDIRVLYRPTLVVDGVVIGGSDAHSMALATFGTEATWAVWFWASLWIAWSLLAFFLTLKMLREHDLGAAQP